MNRLIRSAHRLMNQSFLAAFASLIVLVAIPASAGIANTKHNLSPSSAAGNNKVTAGTEEICVYCHTPHAADTSSADLPPLWNKSLTGPGSNTYQMYSSSTMDAANTTVGSISLACLSCHDGTQAMDNMINAPGSGGYAANGGGVNGLAYTWDTTTGRVDAFGKLLNSATSLAMLGTDLRNDHPIGIQYCGGGPSDGAPATACVDTDFVAPSSAPINAVNQFWVNTTLTAGSTANREKTDMILYRRTFGATVGPSVECGSCHDPHVESVAAPAAGTGPGATFLRISNAESRVCLACHVK